jgi:hypothetical protein
MKHKGGKDMKKILAYALAAVMAVSGFGALAPVQADAATSPGDKIYREGNKTRNLKVNKTLELEVEKGRNVKDSDLWWSVSSGSNVVKITSSDRSDEDVTIKGLKAGTAKVRCKNKVTGGSLYYTIKVTKLGAYNIAKVGNYTKKVEVGDDLELNVVKGSKLKNSEIKWSVGNTNILRFEDGDKTGTEVEVEARKIGTTKVTVKNLHTGGKIVYTIKVVPEYDD